MSIFVWIKRNGQVHCEKWSQDFRVTSNREQADRYNGTGMEGRLIGKMHYIPDDDARSLDELARAFPAPAENEQ
jgi:hypothetical protein